MNDATPSNSPAIGGAPRSATGSLFETTDERLATALQKGPGGKPARYPAEELRGRHWTPVFSYARLCTNGVRYAGMLTTAAFTRLFEESARQVGPRAVWRPELLVAVRRTAGEWDADARRGMLHPEFRSAAGRGGRDGVAAARLLPPENRRLVSLAFQRLPEAARCLLWHAEVEAEELAVPARLLGLPAADAARALERARALLRQYCIEAHRELAPDDACRRYSRLLDVSLRRGGNSVDPDLRRHLADCEHCARSAGQLDHSGGRPAVLLAEGVLGWGARQYLDARPGRAAGGERTTAGPVLSTTPDRDPYAGPPAGAGRRPDTATRPGTDPERASEDWPTAAEAGVEAAASGRAPEPRPETAAERISAFWPGPDTRTGAGAGTRPDIGAVGETDPGQGVGSQSGGTQPGGVQSGGMRGRGEDAHASAELAAEAGLYADSDSVWGTAPGRRPDSHAGTGSRPVTGSHPVGGAPPGAAPGSGADAGPGAGARPGTGRAVHARAPHTGGPHAKVPHPGPRHALRPSPAGERPSGPAPRSPWRRRQLAPVLLAVSGCVLVPLVLWSGGGGDASPSSAPGSGTASEQPDGRPSGIGAGGAEPGTLSGRLRNLGSGDCVGTAEGKVSAGTEVVLGTCTSSKRQQWSYESDGLLRSLADDGLCLDSRLPSSVRLGPCEGGGSRANARYDFTREGQLVPLERPALALVPVSDDEETGLVLKTRGTGRAQRWEIDKSVDSLQMEWITSRTNRDTAEPAPDAAPSPSRTPPPPEPEPTPSGTPQAPRPTASASGRTCYGYHCRPDGHDGDGHDGGGHGGGGYGGGYGYGGAYGYGGGYGYGSAYGYGGGYGYGSGYGYGGGYGYGSGYGYGYGYGGGR
ncbi:RICIN domain-containing protein [Streptomyces sp. NPDC002701]|uniref:RICIN domain-containing protein n=1 Tax=Streptomyces sp. NPDC002701 TaxID=3364661 RepID=UPI0036895880